MIGANRQIGEAFVDALRKLADKYDEQLKNDVPLVFPHSIDVSFELINMGFVAYLREEYSIPSKPSSDDDGLYNKYIVTKRDGSPVDPDAFYFVLRLDTDMAAREAALCYANARATEMPLLAQDITATVMFYTERQGRLDGGLDGAGNQGSGATG